MIGLLFLFAYSKARSIVQIASNIDLPFIIAFWLWWTRKGEIDSNLFAVALAAILTSMFISKFGRQFFRSLLSLSFFSSSVIVTRFWEAWQLLVIATDLKCFFYSDFVVLIIPQIIIYENPRIHVSTWVLTSNFNFSQIVVRYHRLFVIYVRVSPSEVSERSCLSWELNKW